MIDSIVLLTAEFERYNNITRKTYNLCNLHNYINCRLSDYQPIYKLIVNSIEYPYILRENEHDV